MSYSSVTNGKYIQTLVFQIAVSLPNTYIRGLLEKYPTFGREKETGLLGALDT